MNFGETLKKLRKNKNLTQSQLGEKIGVAKSVVSYYENGDRYPSPEILIKIAHTFNVSTDYLLGINREKSINVTGLNEEDIQVVLSVVEALRRKQPWVCAPMFLIVLSLCIVFLIALLPLSMNADILRGICKDIFVSQSNDNGI